MSAVTGWTCGEEQKTPETQGESQQPGLSTSHGSSLISPSAVRQVKMIQAELSW